MAEARAEKRECWLHHKDEDLIFAERLDDKGMLGISILQLKLKVSYEGAKKIIDDYYRLKMI
jgi:hypothetical protein